MPKWLLVLIVVVLLIGCFLLWKSLDECRDLPVSSTQGPSEVVEPDPTVFTLVLEAESYGTFLPVNNQFPCPPEAEDPYDTVPNDAARCRPIHSGFFMQLSDFAGSLHAYERVDLAFANGTETELARSDFKWIDIVCVDNYPEILTSTMAQMLLPVAADDGRLLHKDMDWQLTNLVTLWRGTQGLTVEQTLAPQYNDPVFPHYHDTFTFRSQDACEVRIWATLASDQPAQTYSVDDPATRVKEIRVIEEIIPTTHGGVHHPPWY